MKNKNLIPWDKFTVKLDSITRGSIKCKTCGHTVLLNNIDKVVCTWCGHYVYKSNRQEFKDRLLNELERLK